MTGRYRCYCFTLNNYTVVEIVDIDNAVESRDCSYLCYGVEVGDSGTPHLQGYLELDKATVLSTVKKIPGLYRAHFEPRKGTQEQAIEYCKKDGKFYEFGQKKKDRAGQNENLMQERLKIVKSKIDAGAKVDDIFDIDPLVAVRFDKWIERQSMKRKRVRKEELRVLVYYGKPGTGKTRRAYEQYPDIYAIPLGKDIWFNGYNEQEEVLIDDFCGQMQLKDTLRLLDRYPIQVPTKGGFTWWMPNTIIITTNLHPREWYDYSTRKDSEDALKRRIHGILDFNEMNPITKQNFICKTVQEFW